MSRPKPPSNNPDHLPLADRFPSLAAELRKLRRLRPAPKDKTDPRELRRQQIEDDLDDMQSIAVDALERIELGKGLQGNEQFQRAQLEAIQWLSEQLDKWNQDDPDRYAEMLRAHKSSRPFFVPGPKVAERLRNGLGKAVSLVRKNKSE